MASHAARNVDVPRIAAQRAGVLLDLASHRARRRALEKLRALDAVGEPCTYRLVTRDGAEVPPDQVTEQDAADIRSDLERLEMRELPTLDGLLGLLYAASSHHDRSRLAPALDRLLDCVDYWKETSPERIAALFERLAPSRLARAIGQTLLASARRDHRYAVARRDFLSRFLDDLRVRGAPEATIDRLRKGLEE